MSRTVIRCAAIGVLGAAFAAGTVPAHAATPQLDTARPSLAGTWNVQGGIFKFARNKNGQFVDSVVKQRPGVFCPSVNDKSDQIVLRQQASNPLEYKGTWKWFNTGSCAFVGLGPTTITLSRTGATAVMVSDPPGGVGGSVEQFTIKRVAG
jgi:hypothetical protein